MTVETNEVTQQTGGAEPDIMQMLGHVPSLMQQQQQVAEKTNRQGEVLERLEKVFSKAEPQPDGWYDDVLKAALEAEKQGQSMPLTLKISNELLAQQKANQKLMADLEQLKAKENLRSNPQFQMDQAAYNHIDQAMARELEDAYDGTIPEHVAVAVTQDLVKRIQHTQQHDPATWAKVRSNPELMQQVVRRAVAQAVPPQARRVIAQEQLANATYEPNDMRAAIAEAQEMLRRPDVQQNPALSAKIHESIERSRQMLWESMMPGQGRRGRV